jgi:hypothetical protein
VRRQAIPLADKVVLGRPARRTLAARVVLGVGLVAALAAAYLVSRHGTKNAPPLRIGTSPIVAVDMSWSVSYDNYREIEQTLRDLAGSGRRIGLVLFSDVAYEALPPGTPAAELRPYLRYFEKRGTLNPWRDAFSGGTRIWTGLALARQMLKRDRVFNGSVVLISDLADAPNDRPRLAETLVAYARDRIPIRVVGLDPSRDDESFFRGALAHGGGSVTALGSTTHAVSLSSSTPVFPIALVSVAAALALLLGLNERVLDRLDWSRRRAA